LSKLIESRADFQQMANERLEEAKALLDVGKWSGAYYLAGYAVELALKACIIKTLMATDAFPDKELSRNCYTHSIEKLVESAKLEDVWKIAMDADVDFEANWTTVKDWSEVKRYHIINKTEAEALYKAVADNTHGVLPWLKTNW
jgi:HEPN domain-containing protein